MTYTLYCGDCLDILPTLPSGSIDAVIADPPYGTTACKWDSVIPLDAMWRELKRVIKPRGAVVLFASQPFTTTLIAGNTEQFKYQWVWEKTRATGFMNANYQPLKAHEDILVFSQSAASYSRVGTMTYCPQMEVGAPYKKIGDKVGKKAHGHKFHASSIWGESTNDGTRHPRSVLRFPNDNHDSPHATAKPVDLLRYLVRTYTNPGETVLDFTMGSGTTGVACVMEGRHFIGVELDAGYYDIARRRIESVQPALMEAAD